VKEKKVGLTGGLFIDGMGLCRDENSDRKGNMVETGSMCSSSKSGLGIEGRELG
jgi:hypothetical protein